MSQPSPIASGGPMSEEIIEGEQGLKPVELGFHVLAIDFFFLAAGGFARCTLSLSDC